MKQPLTTPTAGESVVSGSSKFVDSTLVPGPDSVQYTVQRQRADGAGPVSEIITVNFGQAPVGGVQVTVTTSSGGVGQVKFAA